MHIKKSLFRYKMCYNVNKFKGYDVDLYLLKICVKFLEKVTGNKGVKDKKS